MQNGVLYELKRFYYDTARPANRSMRMRRRRSSNTAVSRSRCNHKSIGMGNERRIYALGNLHWHSDSSFKAIPAK